MYSKFNLKLSEAEKSLIINLVGIKYEKLMDEVTQNSESVKISLQRFLRDDVVDGYELENLIFPTKICDVFISYSHNDEELAKCFAGYLKTEFGLNVFIDSYVWGSADDLLKLIDDHYCKQNDGNYSYRKRNLSTSHVHAMLSMAILRVMNKAEAIMFIYTDNSVKPNTDMVIQDENKTYSPWIYEEINFAHYLKKSLKPRQIRCDDDSIVIKESTGLQMTHRLNFNEFTELTYGMILEWQNRQKFSDEHPLDTLYKIVDKNND